MKSSAREVVERYATEFWIDRDMSVADHTHAPDHVYHDPALPQLPLGPEGVRERAGVYLAAVPDGVVELTGWMDDGSTVLCRWRFSGTHTGEIMGAPPTGRSVTLDGLHLCRVEGGRIVESTVFFDTLSLFTQLGLITDPVGV